MKKNNGNQVKFLQRELHADKELTGAKLIVVCEGAYSTVLGHGIGFLVAEITERDIDARTLETPHHTGIEQQGIDGGRIVELIMVHDAAQREVDIMDSRRERQLLRPVVETAHGGRRTLGMDKAEIGLVVDVEPVG